MLIVLALALALFPARIWAQSPSKPGAIAKNPDTFVEAEIDEITSLDPVFPYDNASQGLIYNIYETLIAFDGASIQNFVPRLATKVPSIQNGLISKDGLTYRFPIRHNVHFQDGTLLTPEDVRYSLLRFMLTDRSGGPSALLLEPILGITTTRDSSGKIKVDFKKAERAVEVDRNTVVIRLPRPFAPFLSIMARWSYICSKSWASNHGEWDGSASTWKKFNNPEEGHSYFSEHANGTGPFALERWDRGGKYVLLSRNDNYWRPKAALAHVLIKSVPEFTTRKLMLEAGDADTAEVPRAFVPQIENMAGASLQTLPRLATNPALFFSFHINPVANPDIGSGKLDGDGIPPDFFADADLRKAFSYSFNNQAFISDVFHGKAVQAVGPIPPGLLGYDPQTPHYDYNPAKAREYFQKAWKGQVWEKGFRFTLTYAIGSENSIEVCQILKKSVESLNPKFRVDLRGLEWASYLDKTRRHMLPLFILGWFGDYPDPHDFVFGFYHSTGRYPSSQGYSNPAMDRLIEKAVAEINPAPRAQLYHEILRLGFADDPCIFTVHPPSTYALRDWVAGFIDNPMFLDFYFYPFSKR